MTAAVGTQLISVHPEELRFQFELEKQSFCDLKVVNNTENHVAFKVKTTSPKKYFVRPNTGVIQPWDACVIRVTLQAQREYPPDMQCKDKFLLQSTIVTPNGDVDELPPDTFNKDSGKQIEECKLKVLYVSPSSAVPNTEDEALRSSTRSLDGNSAVQRVKEERDAAIRQKQLLQQELVERTKSRPVASGLLTPFQGLSFLGFQLLLGLGILLQLNNYSRILGASSLLLVFSYPLMKRFTFWPQAYLGLTFNWGALLGWAAVKGSIDPATVFPLYISGVFWTLVYDTIYAHQDKEDDVKVGVRSTALRFGALTKEWITGFGIACISSLAVSGYNAEIGWPYYVFLAGASGHLAWQIWTVDLSSRADCNSKFVSNKWFGAIIFSGILLGRLSS